MTEIPVPEYRRSRRCTGGDCVEVGDLGSTVHIRRSTTREAELIVSPASFMAFLSGIKAGDFDKPLA